jgi:hypothetical protein
MLKLSNLHVFRQRLNNRLQMYKILLNMPNNYCTKNYNFFIPVLLKN